MVLETLYALTSNTKLVKEAMAKGNSSDDVFCFVLFFNNLKFFQCLVNVFLFPRCSDLFARPLLQLHTSSSSHTDGRALLQNDLR